MSRYKYFVYLIVAAALAGMSYYMLSSAVNTSLLTTTPAPIINPATTTHASLPQPPAPSASVSGLTSVKVNATEEQAIAPTKYVVPVHSETTALAAMEAYAVANPDFRYSGREFAGLGFFVEEIGGLKNANGYYWTLFINNAPSELGASSAEVGPEDIVEWRYQKGI